MFKKIALLVLALAMVAPLAVGCKTGAGGEMTLTYNLGAEPQGLDSADVTGAPEFTVLNALFEGLARLDEDAIPQPAAAKDWDVSDDGLTYTFHLRDGMVWSNGDPVTAEDFKYSWLRVLDPATAAEYAYQLHYIKGGLEYNSGTGPVEAVGIEVLDPKTLKVTLANPTPYFTSLLAFTTYLPVHKATVEQFGDAYGAEAANLVTNGPFKLDKWDHRSILEMTKSDNYWDKKSVKLSNLNFTLCEEASTSLAMFETGECDVIDDPPLEEIDRLKADGSLQIAPTLGTYYYLFNIEKRPLDDIRVRQALSMAINRKDIVEKITKGGQIPAYAIVPYGIPNTATGKGFRDEKPEYFTEDIATAKQLLAEAGYPDGKGLPQIEILYNTSEAHKKIAEAIMEMWKQNLGITNVVTRNEEWGVYLETRDLGNYQVSRAGWLADYIDPMTFLDMWTTDNGNNNTRWGDPTFDQLVETTKGLGDPAARFANLHQLEDIFMASYAVAPIYFYTDLYLMKPWVKGASKPPFGPYFEFKTAYIQGRE